jgi:peptidoglycan/LPS O-acetylase OafA/YrhL
MGVRVLDDKATKAGAYRTMDLVRAGAAIAVVWNHCFNMLMMPVTPGDGIGYVLLARSASFGRDAVMVFFVISGYWIARSVTASVAADRWSWPNYTINRLSRLYIVLVPALVLGLILDGGGRFLLDVAPYRALGFQQIAFYDVGAHISPSIVIGNLLFLQDMLVPPLGSNAPLWTLSREFWYYVWFPALLLAARGRPCWPALALTVVTAILAPSAVALFGCWLLGAGVAWLEPRITKLQGEKDWVRPVALLIGLGVWGMGTVFARMPGLDYYFGCYAIASSFAVLLVIVLRYDIGIPTALWPVSAFGGRASFSLYAYHMPVLVVIIAIVCGAKPVPLGVAGTLFAMVVTLALVFGAVGFAALTEARTEWLRGLLKRWYGRSVPADVDRDRPLPVSSVKDVSG